MIAKFKTNNILIILILGTVFYFPFLGGVHLFDWDEVNFAEIAREMILTKNYLQVQINFQPFFEKPPLFFWLQVLSMKLFGINEFAARFPNALTGLATLLVLYKAGSQLFSKRFGLIWVLAYFGSILPQLYFHSGLIDPVFNLFIFIGLWFMIKYKWKKENAAFKHLNDSAEIYLLFSGIFIGLAILTKGPVAYLLVLLTMLVYWARLKFRMFISLPKFILFSMYSGLVMALWLGMDYLKNGHDFLIGFIHYQIRLLTTQDAGHGGFPGYHVVVLLLGCFPLSIFAIRAFFKMKLDSAIQRDFRIWMIDLFWVVLILFSLVQSKIVHYSSMAYFPISFLGALVIYQVIENKISFAKGYRYLLGIIGGFIALISLAVPFIGMNIQWIKPLFKHDIHGLATLDAQVNWTGWEVLPAVLLLIALLSFFVYWHRKQIRSAVLLLLLGTAIYVFSGLIFFIGRIEMYSQNSYVEFCKTLKGKPGYVFTSGFKSYVHLFYTDRQPSDVATIDRDILINKESDQDVYIFCKKNEEAQWTANKNYGKLGSRNGYSYYRRSVLGHEEH